MKIEKTTLIEFNELREEKRLIDNFKGDERKVLLKILDYFLAGNWDVARAELSALPNHMLEYVHPVIFGVLSDVHAREESQQISPPPANLDGNAAADLVGLPHVRAQLEYPKFQILPN